MTSRITAATVGTRLDTSNFGGAGEPSVSERIGRYRMTYPICHDLKQPPFAVGLPEETIDLCLYKNRDPTFKNCK